MISWWPRIWHCGIKLWWYRLWVRADEFHPSLDLDMVAMEVNYPRLKPGACKRLRGTKQ